jgi:type IV secretion system protein VirD4
MSATEQKRPWRRAALALTVVGLGGLVFSIGATQFVAWRLNYHPALGKPLVGQFYLPWSWIEWHAQYAQSMPKIFSPVEAAIAILACLVLFGAYLSAAAQTRKPKRHEGLHGTAHWATREEIEAMDLIHHRKRPGAGVYVGGYTDDKGHLLYLRHNGPEHIAAIAPTRSGKGIGLVVPTLLSWPHSVVVNDQKSELWHLTAGWRGTEGGNEVLRFDPGAATGSVRFNPLAEVRLGTIHEVGDTQNLVTIIVDPDGKGMQDHWAKTSHAFLTGLVLHVLYKAQAKGEVGALPEVAHALSDPARPIDELYKEMLHNTWDRGNPHQTIAAASRDMTNRPEEERGSVLSTAMSFLSLYRDPLVAKNVSGSDFKVLDLMNSQKPVSLYLIVRAEDKDRMKPLLRLVINQLVRVLLRPDISYVNGRAKSPHVHRMLLMLDEFPSYGRLDVFQEALAYIAGYGIKAYLIMQDIAQLWSAYGRDESIIGNCHVRVAYAPNNPQTADWLSRMTGTATIIKEDISVSGKRSSFILESASMTYRETSRPLATPDEVMRLKGPQRDASDVIVAPGEMLVFMAGHAPIKGTQSLYFRDPEFLRRSAIAVPKPAQGAPAGTGTRTFRP